MIKSQHFKKKAYCKPTFVHNDFILRLTGDKLGIAVNNFCSQDVRLSGGKNIWGLGLSEKYSQGEGFCEPCKKKFTCK